MTSAVIATTPDPLQDLTEKERLFAVALAAGVRPSEAAAEAGFSDPSKEARRLRRRPRVIAAVKALVAAREAEARIDHGGLCRLLEASLLVRATDLLEYDDEGVTPIGVKPRESLTQAEELRVRRLTAKSHASAKGHRGGLRWVELELVSPLEIVDRIARLRGYSSDAPQFQVLLAQVQQPAAPAANHSVSLRLLHDVAAELLQGERLDAYLIAHVAGDQDTMARLLREGAAELRSVALALPVVATRE